MSNTTPAPVSFLWLGGTHDGIGWLGAFTTTHTHTNTHTQTLTPLPVLYQLTFADNHRPPSFENGISNAASYSFSTAVWLFLLQTRSSYWETFWGSSGLIWSYLTLSALKRNPPTNCLVSWSLFIEEEKKKGERGEERRNTVVKRDEVDITD